MAIHPSIPEIKARADSNTSQGGRGSALLTSHPWSISSFKIRKTKAIKKKKYLNEMSLCLHPHGHIWQPSSHPPKHQPRRELGLPNDSNMAMTGRPNAGLRGINARARNPEVETEGHQWNHVLCGQQFILVSVSSTTKSEDEMANIHCSSYQEQLIKSPP